MKALLGIPFALSLVVLLGLLAVVMYAFGAAVHAQQGIATLLKAKFGR